jgi:hypothetical protein
MATLSFKVFADYIVLGASDAAKEITQLAEGPDEFPSTYGLAAIIIRSINNRIPDPDEVK